MPLQCLKSLPTGIGCSVHLDPSRWRHALSAFRPPYSGDDQIETRAPVNNDTAFDDRRLGDVLRGEAARPGTDPDLIRKLLDAAAKADALDAELLADAGSH